MPRRRSHLSRSAAVSVAVVALVASLSPSALADGTKETKETKDTKDTKETKEAKAAGTAPVAVSERRAAEAFQAYTNKNYTAAVALYLDAYEAAPSGSILYNIARIYDLKLADRRLALNFYRRYITDPGAQADLIEVASERLRELRNADLVASRQKDLRPPAAGTAKQRVGGSPRAVSDTSGERGDGWSTLRWTGVTVGAVGLAGVGVGGGFGLVAMSKASTANGLCDGNACSSQRGVDAAHAARRDATISNIGLAAGGALLVTGVAMFFLGGESAHEQDSRADIRLGTWATASEASLQVSGRW